MRRSARRSTSAARPSVAGALVLERDLLAPRAHDRHAAVARDGVQPRLQRSDLVARAQAAIGGQERVLHGILGLLARAEHVPAEREQLAVIAS
jgi:hypothetical protein